MERLTTAQAAARSGASRFAIHRAIKSGALHPVRNEDGHYLFDQHEVDTWTDQRPDQKEIKTDDEITPYDLVISENNALRSALADVEKRAAVAEALADERKNRIDDLISMMPVLKR